MWRSIVDILRPLSRKAAAQPGKLRRVCEGAFKLAPPFFRSSGAHGRSDSESESVTLVLVTVAPPDFAGALAVGQT